MYPKTLGLGKIIIMNEDNTSQGWVKVAEADALDKDAYETQTVKRIHTIVDGRYVSIFKVFPDHTNEPQIFAIDSVCFHAGGPIGLGEIEELDNGDICIVCPWHYYHCSLKSGEKLYRSTIEASDGSGTLQPGSWKSVGKRQRKHLVEQRDDGIYLKLNLEGTIESDQYCRNEVAGQRVLHGILPRSSSQVHPHSDSPGKGNAPPHSPNPYYGEGEDVWPDDMGMMMMGGRRRSASPYKQRRPVGSGGFPSSPLSGPQLE